MTDRARIERHDGGANIRGRPAAEVQGMIVRFDVSVRARLAQLVSRRPYIEDLLWSFPAAAHQLALTAAGSAEFVRVEGGEEALALVLSGAPLTAISAHMSLPLWLRRLPPEAFRGAIPELPMHVSFGPRIANHFPDDRVHLPRWLDWVAAAHAAADDDYAIWAAKHFQPLNERGIAGIGALGLYAWASSHPEHLIGREMGDRFEPGMGLRSAIEGAHGWLSRLAFVIYDAPRVALEGPRVEIEGFSFVPLETPGDFVEEGRLMSNCVADYADLVADGTRQVWSVRQGEKRIANVEIRLNEGSGGVPYLAQAHGPANRELPGEVLRAVYGWLLAWPGSVADFPKCLARATPRAGANYRRLLMPYWREKGLMPWCPLQPVYDPFGEMRDCLGMLRAGTVARRVRHRQRRNRRQRQ